MPSSAVGFATCTTGADMGKEHKVKRTAPGASSGNTISAVLSVTIILDEPLEADDAFELKGAGGTRTLTVKDATQLATGAKVLRFTGVKAKQQYRIVHKRSKASEQPIGGEMPLAFMTTSGTIASGRRDLAYQGKAPSGANTFVEYPSQLPKRLDDRYNTPRDVDPDLVQRPPVFNSLKVEDPRI